MRYFLRLDFSDDAVDAGQEAFLSARQGTGLALIEQLVHETCDRKFKDSQHSQFILGIIWILRTRPARKFIWLLSLQSRSISASVMPRTVRSSANIITAPHRRQSVRSPGDGASLCPTPVPALSFFPQFRHRHSGVRVVI